MEVDSTAKRLALEEPREIEAMTGKEFEIRDPDTGAVIERGGAQRHARGGAASDGGGHPKGARPP